MGRLNFNEYAKEGTRAFALAGNQPLKLANNQIKTIVRTSINQVSNAASQSVYAANKDVAPEYEYVATLDSRTSSICQRLDGQKFGYDKGPTPPQHFNCRSTTVPVVDYEGLGLTPPPETKITTRPSETGRVPQKVSYGDWLYEQRARGANDKLLKYEPGELQIKTLGFEKAKYFNRLAAKSNGKDALRQVIRSDGTELTLEQLKKKYGKPSDIKAAKKVTPKVKPKAKILEAPSPVVNKYIKKFEKQSNDLFEEDFDFNKATLDLKKIEEAGKIRNSKSANVVAKAKTQLKEAEEGLKYLKKRRFEIKEQWRRKNLPLLPKTQPLKKLNKKEMSSSLSKYEKDLALKEKALNPKDPLYEDKLDTIRDQQFDIEQMRKRLKADLPVNDFDHTTPMGYIYDRQGFNSKPKRVKTFKELQASKDILKAADGENLILYRGVKEKEFALQFKGIGQDGAQHFPGNGIYGNGTYAASRNYHATGKEVIRQSKRARATAEVYATNYTGAFQEVAEDLSILQKKERVTAFGFKKDAKVVRWQKGADAMEGTDSKWLEWQEMINDKAEKATGLTFNSTGEAASALGIDAYQVPNAGGITGLQEDYWVILNRGALVVADEAGY
jgi:SPP1 gp7 family putative phage head morphogenesis protein